MKVTRTEITRSNREVKENAHTPADLHGCWLIGGLQPGRADRVILSRSSFDRAWRVSVPCTRSIVAASGGSAGLRPDERRLPAFERAEGERPNRAGARHPRVPPDLRAIDSPRRAFWAWSVGVIEDDYFGAFVGWASWCAACVHGGTVHGPGGSSAGVLAAAWGARVRARLSNWTPPAAAAASRAIAAE